jgi:hypothetical protein
MEFQAKILIFTGKQIPISPTGDILIPTVSMRYAFVETNFGIDQHQEAKPFKYDIEKCPGLVLD